MPELPEVETIRQGLKKYLLGHTIKRLEIRTPKTLKEGEDGLIGGRISSIRRFGKVLVIDLASGYSALIHLKMTGQLLYRGPNLKSPPQFSERVLGSVPGKHTRVIFHLDRGGSLYFNDYRKFGWIKVVKTAAVEKTPFIKNLGPEPFNGLNLTTFKTIVKRTKKPIKLLLMDQEKIGGIGNIYANDALWKARINPKRPANSLTNKEQAALFNALIHVLKKSLAAGGSSESAYVTAEGAEGKYQNYFLVYDKEGEVCKGCKKTKIKKIKLAGRGTYFCPDCQK